MKKLIIALFSINIICILYGYFMVEDEKQAQIYIGLSVLFFSFIIMPLFIYYRYKNKKQSDFYLSNLQESEEEN
jgi:tellurite resistance protein TehA-like permease